MRDAAPHGPVHARTTYVRQCEIVRGRVQHTSHTRARRSWNTTAHHRSEATTRLLLLLVVNLLAPAQLARTARGDETDLLAGHGVTAHRGRVADVLVVTSTVGVLDRVHRHTTNLRNEK